MNPITRIIFRRSLLSRVLLVSLALVALISAPTLILAASKKDKSAEERVRVDMKEIDEILKYHPHPEYPVEARRAHVTGRGKFKINFGPDGKVKNIEVLHSTGYIILDHACLWAFVHWQARHPGEFPAVLVPITFSIGR